MMWHKWPNGKLLPHRLCSLINKDLNTLQPSSSPTMTTTGTIDILVQNIRYIESLIFTFRCFLEVLDNSNVCNQDNLEYHEDGGYFNQENAKLPGFSLNKDKFGIIETEIPNYENAIDIWYVTLSRITFYAMELIQWCPLLTLQTVELWIYAVPIFRQMIGMIYICL